MRLVTTDCQWLVAADLKHRGIFHNSPGDTTVTVPALGVRGTSDVTVRRIEGGVGLRTIWAEHPVEVVSVRCLNGLRYFFVCPGCENHCAKLLVPLFVCRACASVGYAKQQHCAPSSPERELAAHEMMYGDLVHEIKGVTDDQQLDLIAHRMRLRSAVLRARLASRRRPITAKQLQRWRASLELEITQGVLKSC